MPFCATEVVEFTYCIDIGLLGAMERERERKRAIINSCTMEILHLTNVLIIDMTLNFELNEAGIHYFVYYTTFFTKF
jgi:hypothetical protein